MSKITKYNISKQSLLWFDSYLKSHEQSVVTNNVKSVPHNIDIGIPQGTILGQILFSIYINDLPEYVLMQVFKCMLVGIVWKLKKSYQET